MKVVRFPRAYENTSLDARDKDSAAMIHYWDKVAAILGGQDVIKSMGEMFLPKFPRETEDNYKFRKSVAKFTNIYRDIAESLAAKPFAEEVKLVDGEDKIIPESILDFIEDVDGDGNNLTVFSGSLFFNGINDAISWLFVDYPNTSSAAPRTIAEQKAAALRPFWSIIMAQNVLEARMMRSGSKLVLGYIRILEPGAGTLPDKVRIFERLDTGLVTWKLYRRDGKTGWKLEDEGDISPITEIPIFPFITGRRDGKRFYFHAPLKDAVELQITLYQQESALEHAKVMTAFPMLSAAGVKPKLDANGKPESIDTGPNQVLYAPADGAGNVGQWSYVEPSANSLTFLQSDVKETKQDLRELGKQPLTAQAGLTVITTAYAAGKSKSVVNAWGLGLKDVLERGLMVTAQWLGVTEYEPEVTIYDDFDTISEEDFVSVLEMRKNRDISRETVWQEARRRSILSAEFDEETELDRLLDETPTDLLDETDEENPKPKETKNAKPFPAA